jgi:hypothetical protein
MTARPASDFISSGSTERIRRQVAVTLVSHHLVEHLRLDMCPIGEIVPSTPAFATRMSSLPQRSKIEPPSLSMAGMSVEVEGHERGRAAGGLDRIVQLFEPAHGAGAGDDMGAGLGEFQGGEISDAARRAGDQRDAVLSGRHVLSCLLRQLSAAC